MAKLKSYTVTSSSSDTTSKSETEEKQHTEGRQTEESQQRSKQESTSSQESRSTQQQQQTSQSQQSTRKALDTELADLILSGLRGFMTDDEMQAYAKNLLLPQLNAGLEAAQQAYDTKALSTKQQQDDLAYQLQRAIEDQQGAYRQNMADIENAALARGMGRSSYLLQTLAGQGTKLGDVISKLTEDSNRKSNQLGEQLALAAQQNATTQGRLSTDYATQLAAKVQELKENQRQEYNKNYLTAISSALGQDTYGTSSSQMTGSSATQTTGQQTTLGEAQTSTVGTSTSDMTGSATTMGESHTNSSSESWTYGASGSSGSSTLKHN